MRRIRSQMDVDRKKRRNNVVLGVIMVGLLVIAPLGYSLMRGNSDDDSGVNEMGIDFVRQNGVWVASFDGAVFGFQKLPSEVGHVDVNVSLSLGDYANQPLYFVNPNEGVSEILNNLGQYVLRYQEACVDAEGCGEDFPVKDCGSNLIIFEGGTPPQVPSDEGNESMVYQNESCVYIVGDAVGGTDAFLYKILGVI